MFNCHGRGRPEYYLSAYGLALKHGFRGTEEEWLESLKPVVGTDYFTEEQKRQFVADVLEKVRQGNELKNVVEEWISENWEKLIAESDIKTGWASLDLEQALSEDVKLTADGRTVSGPGYYLTDPIPCGGLPYKRVRIRGRAAAGDVILAQYQYGNEFVEATGWDAPGEFDAVITLYQETVYIRVQSNGEPPVIQIPATLPEGGVSQEEFETYKSQTSESIMDISMAILDVLEASVYTEDASEKIERLKEMIQSLKPIEEEEA